MAKYIGSNARRETFGLTGHCDACAENGHVIAHPALGCSDVGCNLVHESDGHSSAALAAAKARLCSLAAANERINIQRTATALAVIGHAAALAGAARVSFEFTAIDRGYTLYDTAGAEMDVDSLPDGTEEAITLALGDIDDRRPSLLRPYVMDLDVDKNTGEVNSATAPVATLIEGPAEGAQVKPTAGEAQAAAIALSDLASWARYEAATVSRHS